MAWGASSPLRGYTPEAALGFWKCEDLFGCSLCLLICSWWVLCLRYLVVLVCGFIFYGLHLWIAEVLRLRVFLYRKDLGVFGPVLQDIFALRLLMLIMPRGLRPDGREEFTLKPNWKSYPNYEFSARLIFFFLFSFCLEPMLRQASLYRMQ